MSDWLTHSAEIRMARQIDAIHPSTPDEISNMETAERMMPGRIIDVPQSAAEETRICILSALMITGVVALCAAGWWVILHLFFWLMSLGGFQ